MHIPKWTRPWERWGRRRRLATAATLAAMALGSGGGWEVMTADHPSDLTMPDMLSIQFVSPKAGWAVTPGHLWRTADGGTTWTAIPAPPGFQGRLDPVTALSGTTLVISTMVGRRWHVYSTHDAGQRWEVTGELPVPTIPGTQPIPASSGGGTFVQFVTPQDGWIVTSISGAAGSERVDLAHTTDGGARWTYTWWPSPPPAPLSGGAGVITGIHFVSPKLGFLTGVAQGTTLLVRWTSGTGHVDGPPIPDTFSFTPLQVSAPVRMGTGQLLLPVMATHGGYLAESGNNGISWSIVGSLPKSFAAFVLSPLRATAQGAADLWIAQGRDIWVATQGGRDWHLVQRLPGGEVVRGLTSTGSQVAWVVVDIANQLGVPSRPVALLRTTNAGRTWTQVTAP